MLRYIDYYRLGKFEKPPIYGNNLVEFAFLHKIKCYDTSKSGWTCLPKSSSALFSIIGIFVYPILCRSLAFPMSFICICFHSIYSSSRSFCIALASSRLFLFATLETDSTHASFLETRIFTSYWCKNVFNAFYAI